MKPSLMTIPTELRQQIWRNCLTQTCTVPNTGYLTTSAKNIPPSNLQLVSRQIRDEALGVAASITALVVLAPSLLYSQWADLPKTLQSVRHVQLSFTLSYTNIPEYADEHIVWNQLIQTRETINNLISLNELNQIQTIKLTLLVNLNCAPAIYEGTVIKYQQVLTTIPHLHQFQVLRTAFIYRAFAQWDFYGAGRVYLEWLDKKLEWLQYVKLVKTFEEIEESYIHR